MTTAAEVKKWVGPILVANEDLVLKSRILYLRPLQHIYRNIRFLGSSDKKFPQPTVDYGVLFAPPDTPASCSWSGGLNVGWSTDPQFLTKLRLSIDDALNTTLRPLQSVESLLVLAARDAAAGKSRSNALSRYPGLHAVILAAVGQLAEAAAVVGNYGVVSETRQQALLSQGETLLSARSESTEAKRLVRLADHYRSELADLKSLASLARAHNRSGIGALLGQWELERVRRLGIEHLWEPTPFPVEQV
ncbi:MAG: hypothetical protein WBA73_15325 [Devosia sp.]